MNINTIRDNLSNTIAGKERYLSEVEQALVYYINDNCHSAITEFTTIGNMLMINIAELKRVLLDVDHCITEESE